MTTFTAVIRHTMSKTSVRVALVAPDISAALDALICFSRGAEVFAGAALQVTDLNEASRPRDCVDFGDTAALREAFAKV